MCMHVDDESGDAAIRKWKTVRMIESVSCMFTTAWYFRNSFLFLFGNGYSEKLGKLKNTDRFLFSERTMFDILPVNIFEMTHVFRNR